MVERDIQELEKKLVCPYCGKQLEHYDTIDSYNELEENKYREFRIYGCNDCNKSWSVDLIAHIENFEFTELKDENNLEEE